MFSTEVFGVIIHIKDMSQWWIVPHHFGGSFSCYGVRISSLRGVGINGYLIVNMFDPPPPPKPFL